MTIDTLEPTTLPHHSRTFESERQDASVMPRLGVIAETLLPALLALAVFLPGIGLTPLAGTEGHRAITAHQMVVSHQWLLPMLYDRLYLRKPPLHYWVLATTERLFGVVSEWVWRLPAVLAAAAMAALVSFFARRWFGRGAGLAAGISCVALVPLWAQSRSADIDSLNTLATVICAFLLVECAAATRRGQCVRWTVGAGMAVGAAALLKGPACLPVVLAAAAEPLLRRRADSGRRAAPWIAVLIGVLIFLVYAMVALGAIRTRGLGADLTGLTEAGDNLVVDGPRRLLHALLVPPAIVLFGLPTTFALIPALNWWRDPAAAPRARRVRGLVVTFGVALLICLCSGMVNPRYAYPTLPLLCPIVGAAVVEARRDRVKSEWLRTTLIVAAIALTGLTIARSAMGWKLAAGDAHVRPVVLSVAALAVAVATIVFASRQRPPGMAGATLAASAFAALVLLAAAADRPIQDASRTRRSGRETGEALRAVVGAGTRVITGRLLGSQPEIFYYAGVDVQTPAEDIDGKNLHLPPGRWAVLSKREWEACEAADASRFTHARQLPADGAKPVVVWVDR